MKRAFLDALPAPLRAALRAARWRIELALSQTPELRHLSEVVVHVEDADLVSCDLFDTLVERDVEPPELLHRSSAELAERLLGERRPPIDRARFLTVRSEVEGRLRRAAVARGNDPEVALSTLLRASLVDLAGESAAAEHAATLVAHEVEIECRHVHAAHGAPELLAELRARGKRIVVTSDTCLEERHLDTLLERIGLRPLVDTIYPSSEHELGKWSGRLFLRLLERERIAASRVIHFGDSFVADVRGAKRAGILGLLLRDRERIARRRRMARESQRF